MKYINVFLDNRGLWSASLCKDNKELESIGGSYPKSRSATLDAQYKWGRDFEVKVSYSPMFLSKEIKDRVIELLDEGMESVAVAKELRIKPPEVRAIKAHMTMGTYNKQK